MKRTIKEKDKMQGQQEVIENMEWNTCGSKEETG